MTRIELLEADVLRYREALGKIAGTDSEYTGEMCAIIAAKALAEAPFVDAAQTARRRSFCNEKIDALSCNRTNGHAGLHKGRHWSGIYIHWKIIASKATSK